ncbi:hypothetical protein BGP_3265 [Beggiatoa sp. PS]|nr:hypothetical protein BGP_3265 [Beggiatoa sp. PS]
MPIWRIISEWVLKLGFQDTTKTENGHFFPRSNESIYRYIFLYCPSYLKISTKTEIGQIFLRARQDYFRDEG